MVGVTIEPDWKHIIAPAWWEEKSTMSKLDAGKSGTFRIGGDIAVNRLGFGAMRLTGKGIWDEPADRAECLRALKHLPDLGVNFIDTADSYGPSISEPQTQQGHVADSRHRQSRAS